MTQDDKIITDPEQIKKDDERFEELSKKDQLTTEEQKELGEVKERYGKRMQKKIDKMTSETKVEREARIKAEEEAEALRKENEELKKQGKPALDVPIKEEFVDIGGKKFYTDDTLVKMIEAGKITENEAYRYQRNRDREEDRILIRQDIDKEKTQQTANQIRLEDAKKVLDEYPHWAKNHPEHNPDDPLYKLTTELYTEAYAVRPDGMSKAVARAKQLLRMSDTRVDLSDEHSVEDNLPPEPRRREKEITLSEDEKDAAERLWRDQINPKTGRVYTPNETHTKALEAKKRRLEKE